MSAGGSRRVIVTGVSKRTVPRVTMDDDSVRISTGTVIRDAAGGSLSAAI